jgi:hypothetical protein
MSDHVRSSAHRFEVDLGLAYARQPQISGHGAVWTAYDKSEHRTVFVNFADEHDRGSATVHLTVEQARRTGRLLLELAERTGALPAPPVEADRSARVDRLTAWPPEDVDVQ